MKITKIEVHGFRGFRDYAAINVPDGFLVIQGANGAGKSTVFDAIEFALRGTIGKYVVEKAARESVEDYVWWRGEGAATEHFVRVHFADALETFTVTRTPAGADKTEGEIAAHLCKSESPDNPLEVLTETSLIRDESISAISLDITDTVRYQRVQRALGAIHTQGLVERGDKVVRKADEISRNSTAQEDVARRELNALLATLAEAAASIVQDTELQSAEAELRTVIPNAPVGEINELVAAGRIWQVAQRGALDKNLSTLTELLRLRAEIQKIETPEFTAQLAAAKQVVTELETNERASRAAESAAQKQLEDERVADEDATVLAALLQHGADVGLYDGHCPLCNSAVSDEQYRTAIGRMQAGLQTRTSRAVEAQKAFTDAVTSHNRAIGALENARLALAAAQVRSDSSAALRDRATSLLQEVGLPPAELADPDIAIRISASGREQLLRIEGLLRTLEASRIVAHVRELEEEVRVSRGECERLAIVAARAQKAASTAKVVKDSIARVAGEILDERLSMISPLLSELYLRLKPHADWRAIQYRIRGDVRRFLSLAVGDDLNPQFVFSSGQRRVTGLAFLLSVHLSRGWSAWDTLMLDDPVQHIDDFRALNLVEVLASIRRSGRQVICAVEDEALASLLCRRLGTNGEQSGALAILEPGPRGAARIKNIRDIWASPTRILDRVSAPAQRSG